MVRDPIQVVNKLLSFVGLLVLDDIRCHIQSINGEVDEITDFTRSKHSISRVREPLHLNDQIVWSFIHLHLLGCIDMLLAFAAIPLVITGEGLLSRKEIHAVIQVNL